MVNRLNASVWEDYNSVSKEYLNTCIYYSGLKRQIGLIFCEIEFFFKKIFKYKAYYSAFKPLQ